MATVSKLRSSALAGSARLEKAAWNGDLFFRAAENNNEASMAQIASLLVAGLQSDTHRNDALCSDQNITEAMIRKTNSQRMMLRFRRTSPAIPWA